MIKIVDYGLGNVQAFRNVYRRLNIEVGTADNSDALRGATRLILPGVGAFDLAMQLLERSGMRPTLEELVLQQGVPVLGVCVGMQMLAQESEEGSGRGLGWIEGTVRHFSSLQSIPLQIPHMGWNDVTPSAGATLFESIPAGARFYFLHSYCFGCDRPQDVAASAVYGRTFCCAVRRKNIWGVQFHPEKSHHCGMQLLKNFAEL